MKKSFSEYRMIFCMSQLLEETFAAHSHQGSVRCIAACDHYVASGGNDENLQIYDMVNRKGAGTIMQHTGTVLVEL